MSKTLVEGSRTRIDEGSKSADDGDPQLQKFRSSACISIRTSLSPIITWMKLFGLYHESLACLNTAAAADAAAEKTAAVKCNQVEDALNPNIPHGQWLQWRDLEDAANNGKSPRWLSHPPFKRMRLVFSTLFVWKIGTAGSRKPRFVLQRSYCVAVTFLLALNFGRSFLLLLQESGFGLSYRVVMVIWYVQTTLGTLVVLCSCWRKTHFQQFFQQWVDLFSDETTRDLDFTPTACRKYVMIITAGSVTFLFLNVGAVLLSVLLDDIPVSGAQRTLLCQPLPVRWWSLSLALLIRLFNSAAWTLLSGFTACLASVMAAHFSRLSDLIRLCISKSDGQVPACLPGLRKCHMRMCKLLDALNRYFRLYLAANLSSSVACSTFILYQIVAVRQDVWTLAVNVWWFAGSVLAIVTTSVSLSMLHEAAHGPLEELFAIDSAHADTAHVIQLQLFLSKLTGTTIGATVLDLFVVTKEVLLTILGAFMTYFFLVMQFGI